MNTRRSEQNYAESRTPRALLRFAFTSFFLRVLLDHGHGRPEERLPRPFSRPAAPRRGQQFINPLASVPARDLTVNVRSQKGGRIVPRGRKFGKSDSPRFLWGR